MGIFAIMTIAAAFNSPPLTAMLPKKIEPIIQMHFSVPDETKGWFGRCDTEKEWLEAWNKFHKVIHNGGNQLPPDLDMKKHTVVGICSPVPTAKVILVEVIEGTDAIYIRYRRDGVQWRPEPFNDEESRKRQEAMFKSMEESYRIRLAFVVIPKV
jgi:hypothetical protein